MALTLCGLYQRLFSYMTPRVEPLPGSVQVFGRSHLPTFPSPADPELGLWAPLLLPIPSICQTALGNHVTQGISVSQKSLLAPGPQRPHEGVHSPISTLGVPGSNPPPPPPCQQQQERPSVSFSLSSSSSSLSFSLYILIWSPSHSEVPVLLVCFTVSGLFLSQILPKSTGHK